MVRPTVLLAALIAASMARPNNYRVGFIVCKPTVIALTWQGQRWLAAKETCYIRKALLPPMIEA